MTIVLKSEPLHALGSLQSFVIVSVSAATTFSMGVDIKGFWGLNPSQIFKLCIISQRKAQQPEAKKKSMSGHAMPEGKGKQHRPYNNVCIYVTHPTSWSTCIAYLHAFMFN